MSEKTKKSGNIFVWILFGLLIFSLGGFGISSFGAGVRSIGSVGDTEISVNEYSLSLRNMLNRMRADDGSTIALSTPFGQQIADSIRQQLLATAALENETQRLGLSVGDEAVRDQLLQTPAFQGLGGAFDRELYAEALRRAGFQEGQYEADLRAEAASNLTAAAVMSGYEAHDTMVEILAQYAGERRDMLWVKLDASALPEPVGTPTEEQIQTTYDGNPEAYTAPEMKDLTYVSLTPEMMLGTIEVPEDELQAYYDERSSEYNKPERRLVERLVFPDQAAADAAKAAIDDGSTFETQVGARGLSLLDIDMGDVSKDELGAAGDDVFTLEGLGIVGPLESPLGPALYRVNGVIPATTTSFEDVREDLKDELQRDRAVRAIAEQREDFDDLLAGGATLEELASETEMELGTVRMAPDTAEGIAGYAAFRDAVANLGEDDFPELIFLEDGGLAAVRLDTLLPPALRPLEEVREQVIVDWTREETDVSLGYLGEAIRAARMEGKTLEEQGYTPESHTDLARRSFLDGAPEGMVESLFALKENGIEILAEDGALHVFELAGVTPLSEDETDEDASAMRAAINGNVASNSSADIRELFIRSVQNEAGINLNQAAINAVNSNF